MLGRAAPDNGGGVIGSLLPHSAVRLRIGWRELITKDHNGPVKRRHYQLGLSIKGLIPQSISIVTPLLVSSNRNRNFVDNYHHSSTQSFFVKVPMFVSHLCLFVLRSV